MSSFPSAAPSIPGVSTPEFVTTHSTRFGLSLNTNWEIDLWGRIRNGKQAALADVEAAHAEFAGAQLSLIAQTAKMWFAAIEARLQVKLAEATVENYRESAKLVQERYERGIRPSIDVRFTRSNLAVAESVLSARKDALSRITRQLEVMLGNYPEQDLAVVQTLSPLPGSIPAGLPSELLTRRPDLIAAERRLAAAGARVKQARKALYPRLSLTASGGTMSEELADLIDTDFSVWNIAANLLAPIFQGGKIRAGIQMAEATQRQILAGYRGAILKAFAEVEAALKSESLLAERELKLQEAADQSKAALELAENRYRNGIDSILTVLEAQRRYYDVESQLHTMHRQRLDNRVDLHLALGGGFELEETDGRK